MVPERLSIIQVIAARQVQVSLLSKFSEFPPGESLEAELHCIG